MKNLSPLFLGFLFALLLPGCTKLDELRTERERVQAESRQLYEKNNALDQTLSSMQISSATSAGLFGLNQYHERINADVAVLRAELTEAQVRTQTLELEVDQLQGEADYFRAILSQN